MIPKDSIDRRRFLTTTAATAAITASAHSLPASQAATTVRQDVSLRGRIYKTLKINMVKVEGDLTARFKAAKEAGFDGIEMNSPGMNVEQTRLAIEQSGLPVDGTVCSTHWKTTHSNADQKVRDQALADLQTAIRDTHAVGGNSVLLVVGHGNDGPESEVWSRSVENIRKAIPLAAKLGIHIVIENVWNRFLYDHDGDHTQSAKKFVKYVDEFQSPWIGMQFDIGNHRKYGNMGEWIRQLGQRVVKLDLKGYSRAEQKWAKIGSGDIDWTDVRRALAEINFYGWAAAEVGGGNLARLKEISANMDRVFGLVE